MIVNGYDRGVDPMLRRSLLAEYPDSAFLAAVVVGSGIAAQRLSPGDIGLELVENAAATATGLYAIILMFGPVSGGHFNPSSRSRTRASAASRGAPRSPTSPPRSAAASAAP
jgi:glycerol uptake facilitator-like aquaporin